MGLKVEERGLLPSPWNSNILRLQSPVRADGFLPQEKGRPLGCHGNKDVDVRALTTAVMHPGWLVVLGNFNWTLLISVCLYWRE